MAVSIDVTVVARWCIVFCWAVWISACVVTGVVLQRFLPAYWPPKSPWPQVAFITVAYIPAILILLGGMRLDHNPLYRGIRSTASAATRLPVADFGALIGFGTFCLIGVIASVYSRNSLFFMLDIGTGCGCLLLYLFRRASIKRYLER
jgi:hypothetical protein